MTPQTTQMLARLYVSTIIIVPAWAYFYFLLVAGGQIAESVRDSVTLITGTVLALLSGVAGFWIGSSQSSASKDQHITNLTKGPAP